MRTCSGPVLGGTQGSEGWAANGPGGAWAVENALELLDTDEEFYYDTTGEMLYWAPNQTDDGRTGSEAVSNGRAAPVAPAADALVAVRGKVLVSVTGSPDRPARNISLVDLVFRDTAPTFMDRHDIPSQGDWALVHTAAVVAKGTEGFTVTGCLVTRVDGQGLLLIFVG